jgi:hypothetical protein
MMNLTNIGHILTKKLDYTWRKADHRLINSTTPQIKSHKQVYIQLVEKLAELGYNFIYIDEATVSPQGISTYTWIKKYEHGIVYRPSDRLNVIGAYLMRGKYAFSMKKGSTSSHHILQFFSMLDELMSDWFGHEYKYSTIFIFDNARIHISEISKSFYSKAGIMTINLPPYTPELNKVEKTFAQLKNLVKYKNLSNKRLEYVVCE